MAGYHVDTRGVPVVAAGLILALLAQACAPSAPTDAIAPGAETIRAEDLSADLHYLAGDGMEGRRTQTPGNALAADFIASRFARLGLEAIGDDGSYFHAFDLMTVSLGDDGSLVATVDGAPVRPVVGTDVTPLPFSATASAEGELSFAGFGISAPPLSHDDFAGLDIAGKIVMLLTHEPEENDPDSRFDGAVSTEAAADWRKALAAQQAGAVGVLFVQDVHNHPPAASIADAHARSWRGSSRYTLASWMDGIRIPAMLVSPSLAAALLKPAGRTLDDLARAAEQAGGASLDVPATRLVMTTAIERTRLPDRNVVGMLRGADPEVADEAVLLCAHYDHDGRDGDRIFNGADDDGSGTVAVIEIAEAFVQAAAAGLRPRRSILFAAWNSEESGLLGAWAFTERPMVPLENLVAIINMDMIGRNEEVPPDGGWRYFGLQPQTAEENADAVQVMGYTYSSVLRDVVTSANEQVGMKLEFELDNNPSQLLRRSDHWPFLQMGVPAVFFTTGLHPDYHRETDTPDRIDYGKLQRVARLAHATAWRLAQVPDRPVQDLRRGTLR